jgi:hypothetical protein
MRLGREDLPWTQDVWHQIDVAIADEARRARVAARVIPQISAPGPYTTMLQTDLVLQGPPQGPAVAPPQSIADWESLPVLEIWKQIALTEPQVMREEELGTARTLAIHAANLVAVAEDIAIFGSAPPVALPLGLGFRPAFPPFPWPGLLAAAPAAVPVVPVTPLWGHGTFNAVADGIGILQGAAPAPHHGPYGVILPFALYADATVSSPLALGQPVHQPSPRERIGALAEMGIHGTGTLPPFIAGAAGAPALQIGQGILISTGGNSVEIVRVAEPTLQFLQVDGTGLYHFRVFQRFALRVKDNNALVLLNFP